MSEVNILDLFSSSIKDIIIEFKVVTGAGDTYSNSAEAIEVNTLPISTVTISPVEDSFPEEIKLSNSTLHWDFGDGTTGEGLEVTKWYEYPGDYEIKCTLIDSFGRPHGSIFGQKIKAVNYLEDHIRWSSEKADAKQPETVKASSNSNRLELLRFNSWQSYNALSGRGYYVDLYSKGSRSNAVTDTAYTTDKNIHFTPTWRIVDTSTSKTPTTKVLTTNKEIYVKYYDGNLVHVCKDESGATFAGTSGIGDFYYIDDKPNSYSSQDRKPIFIFAGFETGRFTIESASGNISNYKKIYINTFETKKSVLPIQVKFNEPSKISFTATGIKDFNINDKKFEKNYITFAATLTDSQGNYIKNDFPVLSADRFVSKKNDPYTVKLTVSSIDSISSDITTNDTFKFDTLGAYNGFLRCEGKSRGVKLTGTTKILPPGYFDVDVVNYYIATSPTTTFWQVKPEYYRDYAFDPYLDTSDESLTIIEPVSTVTATSSGLLGFAVDSENSVWMADGDNDHLLKYDINRKHLATVDLRHYVTDEFPLDYEGSITPSSMAVDSEDNIWVTLFDGVSTIKLSKESPYEMLAVAVPDMTPTFSHWTSSANVDVAQGNYITTYYDQSVHNNDIALQVGNVGTRKNRIDADNNNPYVYPNVKYEHLLNPTQVATDGDDNIWVTYSNPLCSMVVKFNSEGTELNRYVFDNETMPTDITVDRFNKAWVVCLNNPADNKPRCGKIVRLRENCTLMYEITSIAGAEFDAIAYTESPEISSFNFGILPSLSAWIASEDDTTKIVNSVGDVANPELALIRGHTYTFQNVASGIHTLRFTLSSDTVTDYTDGITDNQAVDGTISFTVPYDSPDGLYYRDSSDDDTKSSIFITSSAVQRLENTYDEIYMPGSITTDFDNHAWFTHGRNLVSRIHKGDIASGKQPEVTHTFEVGDRFADPLYMTNTPRTWYYSRAPQALDGISTDTANNILVINNKDHRVYAFNASDVELNTKKPIADIGKKWTSMYISDVDKSTSQLPGQWDRQQTDPQHHPHSIRASGDWTGWRRIVNYEYHGSYGNEETGERVYPVVEGESNAFELISIDDYNRIMRYNEDHNFSDTLNSYIFQDTLANNKNFTEWLLPSLGESDSEPEIFGRALYERIANFSPNHSDIDTGTVDSLYSFADMVGHKMENYRLPFPGNIKRLIDIFSIKQSKLFGARDSENDSFDKMGFECHPIYGKNKGELLTASTYMVSAEVPIVVKELFDSKYTKITPGLVASTPQLSANGEESTDFSGLSSYALSGYNTNWGWGLYGSDWTETSKYYEFYSYVYTSSGEQVAGVIDWSNKMTTLKETASSYASWTEKNGTIDTAFDYKLRSGLGLFDTTDPNYTGEEDRIINIKEV